MVEGSMPRTIPEKVVQHGTMRMKIRQDTTENIPKRTELLVTHNISKWHEERK
jgi:hypothetical protein